MGNNQTSNSNNINETNSLTTNTPNNKPQIAINLSAEALPIKNKLYLKSQTSAPPNSKSGHSYQQSSSQLSCTSESWLDIKLDHLSPSPQLSSRLSSVNRPITPLTDDTINVSPLPPLPQQSSIDIDINDISEQKQTTPSPSNKQTKSKHRSRRNSSFSHVNNGITGTHISSRICKIAAKFWQQNIENLPMQEQLEIGCAILFGAMANKEMKRIMKTNLMQNSKNIEAKSLKFLDMLGWLIRYLITDNIDLYSILTRLGIFHQRMGIKIQHFPPMLQSMHETFSYYFPTKYNIEVKYAMDEIFTLAAQIMTGEDINTSSCTTTKFHEISRSFGSLDIEFIKDLSQCLNSTIGREYLYRFLQQTWCDEIAIFLQTVAKFKKQLTPVQRFMIARDIIRTSIITQATFTLNISFECRQNTLKAMQEAERQFITKEALVMESDFFIEVEHEVHKLILENHWVKFVTKMKALQSKSFGL